MYQRKLEKDIRCPLEYGLEIFGGKWQSRIICVLAEKKTLRYSTLRKEMGNITDTVLSATLKELMANGMIARHSYDEIPPRVEYSLTEKRSVGGADFAEYLPLGRCFSQRRGRGLAGAVPEM